MKSIWVIAKRDFQSFFYTPIGYVVVGMFALISGLAFVMSFNLYVRVSQEPTLYGYSTIPDFEETLLSPFMVFCGTLIMFLSPLITMRLFAEEKHRGTIELLFTQPLRDRDILFGKFLAAMGMVVMMMLVVGVHVGIMGYFAQVELLVLVFGVITVFLMGSAFISLGLFVSSISRNQITAGTIAFGLNLLLYIMGYTGEKLPEATPLPEHMAGILRVPIDFMYQIFRAFVVELPVDLHARELAQGVIQPNNVVYYLLFCAFFLFLTFRALESRKWRS